MVHQEITPLFLTLHNQQTQAHMSYRATYIGRALLDGNCLRFHPILYAEQVVSVDHTQIFHPIPGEGQGCAGPYGQLQKPFKNVVVTCHRTVHSSHLELRRQRVAVERVAVTAEHFQLYLQATMGNFSLQSVTHDCKLDGLFPDVTIVSRVSRQDMALVCEPIHKGEHTPIELC